eukprot:2608222-Pleurochrysis_carterae.AAC.1
MSASARLVLQQRRPSLARLVGHVDLHSIAQQRARRGSVQSKRCPPPFTPPRLKDRTRAHIRKYKSLVDDMSLPAKVPSQPRKGGNDEHRRHHNHHDHHAQHAHHRARTCTRSCASLSAMAVLAIFHVQRCSQKVAAA